MLTLDHIRQGDRPLQVLAWIMATGLIVLLGGLWSVQVISSNKYENNRKIQSLRTVRLPASRGTILDRNGVPLAENQRQRNVTGYLGELRDLFKEEYYKAKGDRRLTTAQQGELQKLVRYQVTSNLVYRVSSVVGQPKALVRESFERHYDHWRYMPMPIVENLTPVELARFVEWSNKHPALDLENRTVRHYPHGSTAAHILGQIKRIRKTPEDEDEISYNYSFPDLVGALGIERIHDRELRGTAGGKSILINNMLYRQEERILSRPEPGHNVVLTIDVRIQKITEEALKAARLRTKGAVVVMDVITGDILAIASEPTYDPNVFAIGPLSDDWKNYLFNKDWMPQVNRATYGSYTPGSIFKIVVALACLENGGLDPFEIYESAGLYRIGNTTIKDTAGAGDFNFRRAFIKSSNPYFIEHGWKRKRMAKIIDMGDQFYLGKKTGLFPGQELAGKFPNYDEILGSLPGEAAILCIGQGAITVTPLQMAVMVSAVANGGAILEPRIVARIEPQDPFALTQPTQPPVGRILDRLNVSRKHLKTVQDAMLGDVEDAREGSGNLAFVPGFRVCGKTGTAEVKRRIGNRLVESKNTWFVSYAPYEAPRYAVVVLVEDGESGKTTAAPVAKKIYETLKDLTSGGTYSPSQTALVPLRNVNQSDI